MSNPIFHITIRVLLTLISIGLSIISYGQSDSKTNSLATAKTDSILAARDTLYAHKKYDEILLLDQNIGKLSHYYNKDRISLAKVWGRHGYFLDDQMGKYDRALLWYNRAIDIFDADREEDHHAWQSWLLGRMGNIYTRLGEYDKAEVVIRNSIDLYLDKKLYTKAARAMSDLGICYTSKGKQGNAITTYKKGIKWANIDKSAYAQLLNRIHLANVYINIDSTTLASEQLDTVLRIHPTISAGDLVKYDELYSSTKVSYEEKIGQYHEAIRYQRKYINILPDVYGDVPRREYAKAHIKMGNLFLKQGLADSTRTNIRRAMLALTDNEEIFPSPDTYFAENSFYEINLLFNAYCLDQYQKTNKTEYLDSIISSSERGLASIITLQDELITTTSTIVSNRDKPKLAYDAIHAIYLSQKEGYSDDKTDYFFRIAKGSVLDKAREESQNIYQLEKSDQEAYLRNKAEIAQLKKQLTSSNDYRQKDAVIILQEKNKSLINKIVHDEKSTIAHSNTIDYLIGDVYVYVLKRIDGQASLYQVCKTEELSELVNDFHGIKFLTHKPDELTNILRKLYTLTLQPLEPLPDAFSVIPDGILSSVPYDILIDSAGAYVIEHHTIQTKLSQYTHASDGGDYNKLACIYPYYGAMPMAQNISIDRSAAYPLPFAEEEIGNITTLYDQPSVSRTISLPDLASIFQSHDIFHYAGHAKVWDDESYLLINKDQDIITSDELSAISSDLRLAILSACETGTGKVARGEGTLSLTRAFIENGTDQVINSLWTVNDQTTSSIMQSLHRHIRKGENPQSALRSAKLEYLKNADQESLHPYYWGGFVCTTALEEDEEKSTNYTIIILLTALVIGLFIYLLKTKST